MNHRILASFPVVAICLSIVIPLFAEESIELKNLRSARQQLAERPFRVIFNNDGCDALHYPQEWEINKENFLSRRTTSLKGTGVTTISYCPTSSGFGYFTQKTKAGIILDKYYDGEERKQKKTVNATGTMIANGYDPLDCVLGFGEKEGFEVFWAFRMNDTHDVNHRIEKPHMLFPPLKQDHPEWLFGKVGEKMRHGRWSAVDYSREEITELAFRFVEEVCKERNLNGIELDFCRHFHYFRSVAQGGIASKSERETLTNLMRRIRTMTEQEGLRRGSPIQIAIRTVDDSAYCREVGIDLELWMQEKLADIFIGSDYFQLRPWSDWVDLGRKYDVAVYAGLSESRIKGEDDRFKRNSTPSYDGRVTKIWASGMNGLYIFNVSNPKSPFLTTCNAPEKLQKKNKVYFHSVRGGNPNAYLKNGERFRKLRLITPEHPLLLPTGTTKNILMDIPEKTDSNTKLIAHCRFKSRPAPEAMRLIMNGIKLEPGIPFGDDWVDVDLPIQVFRLGENSFDFEIEKEDATLLDFVVEIKKR